MKRSKKSCLAALFAILLVMCVMPQIGQSATITDLPVVSGPGIPIGVPTAVVGNSNNDDYSGPGALNPNQISFIGINISGFDPIDFVIPVSNSGGTTEYFLDLGTAVNQSGTAWSAIRVEMGSGSGSSFQRSTTPLAGVTGLDFDFPNPNPLLVSPDLPDIDHQADLIVFSGGTIAAGDSAVGQDFSFDVPDIVGATSYQFTIRMQAVAIPEPASMAFVIAGIVCAGIVCQRRRDTSRASRR